MLPTPKKSTARPPQLALTSGPLEEVEIYEYLGVHITTDLSWSTHINHICRKLLGLSYRHFYPWTDSQSLRLLYLTCIRPNLVYAAELWDPFLAKDISRLEQVQKFAAKICCRSWSGERSHYNNMLESLSIPTLEKRRKELKLRALHCFIYGKSFLPPGKVNHFAPSYRTRYAPSLSVPYARTNSYYHSFFPSTLRYWNSKASCTALTVA